MARKPKTYRRPRILFVAALLVGAALVGWMGTWFAHPFVTAAEMARQNEQLEKKSMELQLEQQELRKQDALLQTDAGMELEARRRGYIKAGEVPLIIPTERAESARP